MNALDNQRMDPKETFEFVTGIYALAERDITHFDKTGDDDFSFAIPGVSRFRVSTFKQRGSYSAVIRVISFTLPEPSELHIPEAVMRLADSNRGMVLVTGPAGSGKSTTLACEIVAAVESGEISESRHNSYIALYNEAKDIKEWEKK